MRDLVGQTLGSYRIEALLGRGGMGEVYRARHLRLANRVAAVKILPSYLASEPDFLRRFELEANNAGSLDHPNILPVWDYGEQGGIPYLAMPLINGGSLKELLERQGPLPLPRAEQYLGQIADALDYAHERGIIHRDVKPANILLRDDGRLLLADFGIAKAVEAAQGTGLTQAGTGIGTPEYMAPEQIEGRAEARSDQYSLGIVLYQMLTGDVPYGGATPFEIALKQMQTPPPPIRQIVPGLPPAVEQVLNKALAKDPAARYPTTRDFAAAFHAALTGGSADPTVLAATGDLHAQRTAALPVAPDGTMPLPVEAVSPTARYEPQTSQTRQYVAPAPVQAPPPAPSPPRRGRSPWPLALAAAVGLLLVLGASAFAAFSALGGRTTPTATPDPAVAHNATATVIAATVNANAFAGTAVIATANANATQGAAAVVSSNATATAGAEARAAAQTATTDAAGAVAAAQTATADARSAASTATAVALGAEATAAAEAASANATATADARAANAAASATARAAAASATSAAVTATAGARSAEQTAAAGTRVAAQTATAGALSAGQTATAGARPTPTPPRAPTTAPTAAPTRAAGGAPTAAANPALTGPRLAPLTGGKTYADPEGRFTFNVPQAWTQSNEVNNPNVEVQFQVPGSAGAMRVALEDVSAVPGLTVDQYNAAIERQLAGQYEGYTPVSVEKVIVGNQQAYRRIFRATDSGVQIQAQLVYFVLDNTAHVLLFASRPDNFAQQAPTFDAVAGTYRAGR